MKVAIAGSVFCPGTEAEHSEELGPERVFSWTWLERREGGEATLPLLQFSAA